MNTDKIINAIDICSGAGGWACAARGLPIRIVSAFDLWEAACKTYQLNHPTTIVHHADLREEGIREAIRIIAAEKNVQLILGGIPCEWLSSYRVLNPTQAVELADQRATLDACLGIVKMVGPRYWCLEDVKPLVGQLPLMTPWTELNARHWSPQRRKRIFVGNFPVPPRQANKEVMRDRLRAGPYRIGRRSFNRTPQLARTFNRETTLAAYPDRKSPTILKEGSQRDAEKVVVDPSIAGGKRQLEWQECAKLQGFPDDYVFYGSPTDVSLMIGRAVQIDLARAILEAICKKEFGAKAA